MNLREAYRVVATDQDGKVVAEHYLYSETLPHIQLGILLKEQQYNFCAIVLYCPQGKVVTERRPVQVFRKIKQQGNTRY